MSKLSQLKQKAYQAGKDRNWELAISVYQKILELEKSNPTVINELGDLCLKSGDARQAVKHFLNAAAKYRKTGLLNNSVAICKKILRHDDSNMHAHWYLAEIRSSQDLVVEGENHALAFMDSGEKMGSEIQEIFQKRCLKLLEMYPASARILERLTHVFRSQGQILEANRAACLGACMTYDAGDEDAARKAVDELLVASPELKNYAEFGKWNKRVNPEAAGSGPLADYNSVSLDTTGDAPAPDTPADAPAPVIEVPVSGPTETSYSDIQIDVPEPDAVVVPEAPEPTVEVEPVEQMDEEGCLVIDTDDSSDMADLIAQATKGMAADEVTVDTGDDTDAETNEVTAEIPVDEPAPAPDEAPEDEAPESVDLLAQILSEDSGELAGLDTSQLDTIAAEIGSVVGANTEGDDADRLYEMGMVYLEMGLFDKAAESFETAAADDDYTIRAHEMWGITLQRAGKPDEAITVLTAGLQFAEADSRENLGLRYHIGRAHELADRAGTAVEIYEEIQSVAPNFLDISTRLSQLVGV